MKCPPRRFFWLLFWLGLVMFAMLCFPVSPGIMPARKVKVLAVIKDLQFAIKGFKSEYGRYPLAESEASEEDLAIDSTNSRFLGSLLGDDLQDNSRGIMFVDLPMAKDGRGGLVGDKSNFRLLDEWGNPYEIVMDTNHDNQVRNPDRRNPDPKIQ